MTASEPAPLATFAHDAEDVSATLAFLKRVHSELRTLRRVRVWTDRLRIYDVNGDCFEVTGVGYPQPEIARLLKAVYTVFDPQRIHEPHADEFKEFLTGRRHPWAEDRVM